MAPLNGPFFLILSRKARRNVPISQPVEGFFCVWIGGSTGETAFHLDIHDAPAIWLKRCRNERPSPRPPLYCSYTPTPVPSQCQSQRMSSRRVRAPAVRRKKRAANMMRGKQTSRRGPDWKQQAGVAAFWQREDARRGERSPKNPTFSGKNSERISS